MWLANNSANLIPHVSVSEDTLLCSALNAPLCSHRLAHPWHHTTQNRSSLSLLKVYAALQPHRIFNDYLNDSSPLDGGEGNDGH